ncbi:hypothetical protein ACPA9J_13780 [Pseudomonas aeruginosa]|nr:hypothetical protein HMPREF3150_02397 [Pseudomonas aeruginosa]
MPERRTGPGRAGHARPPGRAAQLGDRTQFLRRLCRDVFRGRAVQQRDRRRDPAGLPEERPRPGRWRRPAGGAPSRLSRRSCS